MKFAPCTRRIKQVGHSAADNRADNTEDDCPHDREMRVHERFGHTTHEEADKDIPDEMKHIFLSFAISKSIEQYQNCRFEAMQKK